MHLILDQTQPGLAGTVETLYTVHVNSRECLHYSLEQWRFSTVEKRKINNIVAGQLPFPTFVKPQVWPLELMGPTKIKVGLKHNQT
jgi:thiamine pyrophosphokinase